MSFYVSPCIPVCPGATRYGESSPVHGGLSATQPAAVRLRWMWVGEATTDGDTTTSWRLAATVYSPSQERHLGRPVLFTGSSRTYKILLQQLQQQLRLMTLLLLLPAPCILCRGSRKSWQKNSKETWQTFVKMAKITVKSRRQITGPKTIIKSKAQHWRPSLHVVQSLHL